MHTPTNLDRAIEEAVSVLGRKGVIAFPTDTLYGLGADAFCTEALGKIFEIKGRPGEMALPILVEAIQDLDRLVVDVPDMAWALAGRFWPGPLTLILKKSSEVPDIATGGRDSVAVRMPNHPVPKALVRGLGRPITGTSANPSGGPNPTTAQDVETLLGDRVNYIIDGGPAMIGTPSTVLDLTGANPVLLRPGAIDYDSLQSVCSIPIEIPACRNTQR